MPRIRKMDLHDASTHQGHYNTPGSTRICCFIDTGAEAHVAGVRINKMQVGDAGSNVV